MRTRVNHEDEYSHLSFLDDRQAFSLLFSCKESLWKLFNQWNGSSPGFLDFVLEERIAAEHCLLFRCHIFGQSESIKQKVHYELFEWGVETWCGLRVQS